MNYKKLIPINQPYKIAPFTYGGTESVTSIPANVTDWELVELHDALTPNTTIALQACFIWRDGVIVGIKSKSNLTFTGIAEGNYHIFICHRNHLGIRNATAQSFTKNTVSLYDFTTDISKASGSNAMIDIGTFWAMPGGNVDYTSTNRKQVIYFATVTSDVDHLKSFIINALGNTSHSSSFIGTSVNNIYDVNDVNMDGLVRFSTAPSDMDL